MFLSLGIAKIVSFGFLKFFCSLPNAKACNLCVYWKKPQANSQTNVFLLCCLWAMLTLIHSCCLQVSKLNFFLWGDKNIIESVLKCWIPVCHGNSFFILMSSQKSTSNMAWKFYPWLDLQISDYFSLKERMPNQHMILYLLQYEILGSTKLNSTVTSKLPMKRRYQWSLMPQLPKHYKQHNVRKIIFLKKNLLGLSWVYI